MQTLYCVGMPKQDRILVRPAKSHAEALGIAVIASAIIWFYGYLATSHSATPFAFNKEPTDYYHYLVDGFLHGQLSLRVKPPAGLASLPNPYDPSARMRIGQPGWADMTYFKGRYYLYFGVAPAVVLFLPFKLLTGLYFPEFLACVVFCAGGYAASLALFLGLRRRLFPECGTGVVWLGTLMLGLGNFCVVMLTRSQFYEVPISSAYCFSSLALLLLVKRLIDEPRRRLWLWLASGAFGLAVASRPNFVFASIMLGIGWLGLWWVGLGRRGEGRRGLFLDGAALGLPLALILAGMFAYNYERFGSPLDFGQRYQLSGGDEVHMTLMGWQNVPINLYYYFWAPARLGRFFPFVDTVRPYSGTPSNIYYGVEDPFGLLTNMPCFLLALAAPLAWAVYFRRRRAVGWILLLCGACFVPVCAFELLFVSATNRYMVDFLPPLLLMAAVGLLMTGTLPLGLPWRHRLSQAVAAMLIAYTAFFNAMAAFQHNGLFQHHQPAAYDRIASWFNYPIGSWELLTHHPYGPVELTVKLPANVLGTTEPLVVTGRGSHADFVYLYYTDGGSIQIGFSHMGDTAPVVSQPIALDYSAPHRIGVATGSLYPPVTHPYFARWPAAAAREAKHELLVTVDGVPYMDAARQFHEASPGVVAFGENPISGYAGHKFSGQLLAIKRQPIAAAMGHFYGGGFVRLAFIFPRGAAGRREPILASGTSGSGDVLFVAYRDDSHVILGFQHAGAPPILSETLTIVPGRIQQLEASLGSFYDSSKNSSALAHALVVRFNSRLIWAQEADFFPATTPTVGTSAWPGGDFSAAFSGTFVAVQPISSMGTDAPSAPFALTPYWVEAVPGKEYGALRLHLDLPQGRAGSFEPILVSGPSVSQADYVWVQYLDSARIQLGYEHTSGGGPASGAIPIDYAHSHVLEIDVPSLFPQPDSPYYSDWPLLAAYGSKSRVRLVMDGEVRIDARAGSYESTPAQTTIGENRISSTFGRKFTGKILKVERSTRMLPPGLAVESGPLEIALQWPDAVPQAGREAILATGGQGAEDSLFIDYKAHGDACLVAICHDGKSLASTPIAIAAGSRAVLRIAWGGLFPDAIRPRAVGPDEWRMRQRLISIELDGRRIVSGEGSFILASPQGVGLGAAVDGAQGFSGSILSVRRLSAAR